MRFRGNKAVRGAALAIALLSGQAVAQDTAPPVSDRAQYDQLFERMLANPSDLDTMFAFSKVATRLGEYDQAISTLERMLMFNPDLPRVRLELGALYFRVGAYEVARTYFQQAASGPSVPDEVREKVLAYLAEIDNRTARSAISGWVMAGLQYQTNPTAAPGLSSAVIGGVNQSLDDAFRRKDDVNAFLSGNVIGRWDFDNQYGEAWEARANAYLSKQFDQTSVDVAVFQLQTGAELALLPDWLPATTIYPFVLAELAFLDDDRLYAGPGAGFELRHEVNNRLEIGLDYTLRYRDYNRSSTQPTGPNQTGYENAVGLIGAYRFTPSLTGYGQLFYEREDARRGFFSNDRYGLFGALTYEYPSPYGGGQLPWAVTAGAGFAKEDYDRADPTVSSKRRRDEEWTLFLGHSFRLTETWSIEAQVAYTDNPSNIELYEYDNFSVLVGVQLTF